MKTAVSLPDKLFRLAETTARRLGVSRSQLYAHAVTERLNEIYSRTHARVDARLHRAQLRSLDKDSW